ncbi:MAG: hypothetical protein ACOVRN_07250 [Flavobacterium sp.]
MNEIRVIAEIILKIYQYSLLGIAFLGLVAWKKPSLFYRMLSVYLLLMTGMEFFGIYLAKVLNGRNHIFVLLDALTDVVFFSVLYGRCLLEKKTKLFLLLSILSGAYICFEIFFNFMYKQVSVNEFQPYSKIVSDAFIIILALNFLYEKMNAFTATKVKHFWFNNIVMLYFTINLLVYLPFNFLVNESTGVKFVFWTLNIFCIEAFYLFLLSVILKDALDKKAITS